MAYVTYDHLNDIYQQKQPTGSSCAATCVAMCIGKSIYQLEDDGVDINYLNWSLIESLYGVTYNNYSSGGISRVLSILQDGYPAIAKVASNDDHWVVIYRFDGDDENPQETNFRCCDPATGTTMNLVSAYHYDSVSRVVYYS